MADEADLAFELQSQEIEMACAATARNAKAKTLPAIGTCHYCDSTVPDGARFCDEHCAADWEHEQRLKALAYGPRAAHSAAFN